MLYLLSLLKFISHRLNETAFFNEATNLYVFYFKINSIIYLESISTLVHKCAFCKFYNYNQMFFHIINLQRCTLCIVRNACSHVFELLI